MAQGSDIQRFGAVDYAEVVLRGHVAWFELLARVGSDSRRVAGALAVVTGVQSNSDNGIAVDPETVDLGGLEALLAWLRASDVPASCVLTKPADAATLRRLGSLGLTPDNDGREMGRSLDGYQPPRPTARGYEIAEATTAADVMDGLLALGDDWYEGQDREARHRLDLCVGVGRRSPVRHWVARRRGVPVAMATSFRVGDVVILQRCGVDALHRRRGVATALTAAWLPAAIADGATAAVLSPSPDGYELHRHLGFSLVRSHHDRWFHFS